LEPSGARRAPWDVDDAALDAVKRIERVKQISNPIGRQIKAGNVPPDLTMDFRKRADTALDALPAWESEFA